MQTDVNKLKELAKLLRYYILTSTTEAGSGHPTSSLSAVELMAALMFGGYFKYDIKNPQFPNNDRLIFSKGHASPLFYALWAAAGGIPAGELSTLRKFNSRLEGHPTMEFPFTEAATGSLGQGLSVGAGMALNAKYLDKSSYKTFVLLGDGEMAEGNVWEALEFSNYYNLSNLIAIIDVNKYEQTGETMLKWDVDTYRKRFISFGWDVLVIENGNDMEEVLKNYEMKLQIMHSDKPLAIIAKTVKGKGVSFLENVYKWHGKALNKDELEKALQEIGKIDLNLRGSLGIPQEYIKKEEQSGIVTWTKYNGEENITTRKAFGNALINLHSKYPDLVVLDPGIGNSTFTNLFEDKYPDRFFKTFIAEQNAIAVGLGLSKTKKDVFIATYGAFLTRAHDQIRMAQYSNANLKIMGSHAGVSVGQDGASQMGLEDISMFRCIQDSVVLYPSDAVSTEKLTYLALEHKGLVYLRTTRFETPILYLIDESFKIGGSKVVRESVYDVITVVGAGITLHEALKAYDELAKSNIFIRIIDLYSIKPLDKQTLTKAIRETKGLIVVEDHYPEGGIAEAVRSALENSKTKIYSLAVRKMPHSGKPEELLDYEEISYKSIVRKVKELLNNNFN